MSWFHLQDSFGNSVTWFLNRIHLWGVRRISLQDLMRRILHVKNFYTQKMMSSRKSSTNFSNKKCFQTALRRKSVPRWPTEVPQWCKKSLPPSTICRTQQMQLHFLPHLDPHCFFPKAIAPFPTLQCYLLQWQKRVVKQQFQQAFRPTLKQLNYNLWWERWAWLEGPDVTTWLSYKTWLLWWGKGTALQLTCLDQYLIPPQCSLLKSHALHASNIIQKVLTLKACLY